MDSSVLYGGHVNLWHAWQDSKGLKHSPCFYKNGIVSTQLNKPLFYISSLGDALRTIGLNQLFVLCNDILDIREFPYANELIGHKQATPYLSRTGGIPAMAIKHKCKCGYLVPAKTWLWEDDVDSILIENMVRLFSLCGRTSSTLASLSEKLLRATLPQKLFISRPSIALRRDILNNNSGGRIDKAIPRWYRKAYVYDENKSYLDKSQWVPSPFIAPVLRTNPTIDQALEYPTGWWKCTLVACFTEIPPIQIDGESPVPGLVFTKWLWTGELLDCLEAGYQFIEIKSGYGFREMSSFLVPWADFLWELFEHSKDEHPHIQKMIKGMMVGLFGRMLRQPETLKLIPYKEAKAGIDISLMLNWKSGEDKMFSDWAIHPELDNMSTALCQVGSYVVAEGRRKNYHMMLRERQLGNTIISGYIDSFYTEHPLIQKNMLGIERGFYKEECLEEAYVDATRMIAKVLDKEEHFIRAPGYEKGSQLRLELWKKYRNEYYENISIL